MPKLGANLKRRRHRGANERRQWAAAVVQKAMPGIMESLIEAASLGEGRPALPSRPACHGPDEGEDESLAALLLRLLRTPETAEDSDTGADQMTSASENHR